VTRAWAATDTGRPVPGTAYTITVGAGGAGGQSGAMVSATGGGGGNGAAYFSWT
jgi:hypothetical protein